MDDSQTPLQRHRGGHLMLGHGIHGGRHERQIEGDVFGQFRGQIELVDAKSNFTGEYDAIAKRDA